MVTRHHTAKHIHSMDPLRQLFQRRRALAEAAATREASERLSRVQTFLRTKYRSGRWKDGLSVLSRAHAAGIALDSSTLAVAINTAGYAKQFSIARKIFDYHNSLKIEPGLAAHHAILNAASTCGRWQYAVSHLVGLALCEPPRLLPAPQPSSTTTMSCAPNANRIDTKMLAHTLTACVNQWRIAAALFSIMRKPGVPVRTPLSDVNEQSLMTSPLTISPVPLSQKCDDTRKILSSLTASFARAQQWKKCLSLLQAAERQRLPLDPSAYNYTLRTCFEADRFSAVAALMGKMIARGIPPQEDSCRVVLSAVEEECARMGEETPASTWVLACVVFNALASQGLRLNRITYEGPMRACCAAGRWEQAAAFLREMRNDGLDIGNHNFESVAVARIRSAGRIETALRLLRIGAIASLSGGASSARCSRALEDVDHPMLEAERCRHSPPSSAAIVEAAFAAAPGERLMNAFLTTALRLGELDVAKRCAREMRQRSLPISLETLANRLLLAEASGRPMAVLRHYLVYQAIIDSQRQEILSVSMPSAIGSSSQQKMISSETKSQSTSHDLPPPMIYQGAVTNSSTLVSVSSLSHADYRLADGVAKAVEKACVILGNKEPLVSMAYSRLKRELHEQQQQHVYTHEEQFPFAKAPKLKKVQSDEEIIDRSIRRRHTQ